MNSPTSLMAPTVLSESLIYYDTSNFAQCVRKSENFLFQEHVQFEIYIA